jgi:hypothetical protein
MPAQHFLKSVKKIKINIFETRSNFHQQKTIKLCDFSEERLEQV